MPIEPWNQENATANNAALERLLKMWDREEQLKQAHWAADKAKGGLDPVSRAKKYLEKEPASVGGLGGGQGSNRCYHVACICYEGFGLSVEETVQAMQDWNARCTDAQGQPWPWSEQELRHKAESAAKNCDPSKRGYKLQENRADSAEGKGRHADNGRAGADPEGQGAGQEKPAEDKQAAEKEPRRDKPSQADLLVALVEALEGVELFRTSGGNDCEPYATVPVGGHRETWPIKSNGFRRWLGRLFFERFKKVPGSQALQDALTVIAGKAIYEGEEQAVAVRVAEHAGALWLDLADEQWRAVQITPEGWQVVTNPPVRFVRKRGMLPIPVPVPGGTLDELRGFLNLPDDGAWRLFVAFLLAALRPGRPFPILVVNGEQGSAKSTLCRVARKLLDPNKAPLRRPPRDVRDLMIAANNGWLVVLDNLSHLFPDLSDVLCCLATGGGFGTRELYTDGDEKLFDAMRPVILNGIEDIAVRPDLLDRGLALTLPVIEDEQRRDEEELWRRFEEARPRILGALLGAVSAALRNRQGLADRPAQALGRAAPPCPQPAPCRVARHLRQAHENRHAPVPGMGTENTVTTVTSHTG